MPLSPDNLEWLEQLTSNISEVFWLTDVGHTRVFYISPGYERIWGRSCASLIAEPRSWLNSLHPDDRESVTEAFLTRQATGGYDVEYRIVRPDGQVAWIHDRAFPVRDSQGNVYRIAGIAEDITQRKRTETLLQLERDLGVILSSTGDLSSALKVLLDVAVRIDEIDSGGVYLADPETGALSLVVHHGLSDEFIRAVAFHPADSLAARVVAAGLPIYSIPQLQKSLADLPLHHERICGIAILPLVHEDTVLGSLNLASHFVAEFSTATRNMLEAVAAEACGAIARIRAAEALQMSEARLRAIATRAPIILLAGNQAGLITFEEGQGLSAIGVPPGEHIGCPVEKAFSQFPELVANVRRALAGEEFRTHLRLDAHSFDCWLSPTRGKDGKLSGFIAVANDFTERQQLQRQILEISDREQARIGQDLHDGLSQQLVSLAFDANSLEQRLTADRRPEAIKARRIAEELDRAITESRRLSRGLFPVRLEGNGLHAALDTLAASTSQRFGVRCDYTSEPADASTTHATAMHLYRIAQEAVINAVKHGRANHISILLAQSPGELKLEIRDNGRGFDPAVVVSSPGMGLHIMDYRARAIGASTLLAPNPDGGSILSCTLPIGSP